MIRYRSDIFGLRTLLMWNGSAAFRAVVPAVFSTVILYVYWRFLRSEIETVLFETYVIAAMSSFFGFLLTTRLNFAYRRWWEATSMCFRMTSKLIDSATCLASFHLQAKTWNAPKSFGEQYAGKSTEGAKQSSNSGNISHMNEDGDTADNSSSSNASIKKSDEVILVGSTPLEVGSNGKEKSNGNFFRWIQQAMMFTKPNDDTETRQKEKAKPKPPQRRNRRTMSMPNLNVATKSFQPSRNLSSFASERDIAFRQTNSDFLDEMVHLYSLLVAVAMASLRHDVEGSPSPLTQYEPGSPFPPFNSEDFRYKYGHLRVTNEEREQSKVRQRIGRLSNKLWNILYFLAGMDRSAKQRTLYNARRPFGVLGGVSELEARRLQLARGPMAQVALCQLWLKEFIAREHLHGSTGEVAGPIVGAVYHYLTDGILAYHQCRKIAYVPFPFPHEQLTLFFKLVVVFAFPLLYVSFVNHLVLACGLNFTTLLCLVGIYEVAKELSNPYNTVPNDIPLNRFQTQFNESLRCLTKGYHPDSVYKDATKE